MDPEDRTKLDWAIDGDQHDFGRIRKRDDIEVLAERIHLLRGEDRAIMAMYLNNGVSFYQMAKLMGVSEGTVSRRVRRLKRMLIGERYGKYVGCVHNRERLSELDIAIANDYFLGGLGLRRIARRRGISYYHVRKKIGRIKGLCEDWRSGRGVKIDSR